MENQYFITYPDKKNSQDIHFKLNSDDYTTNDIRKVTEYLKNKGYNFKYTRSYSKIKIMSWGVFKISTDKFVSFETNEVESQKILTASLNK